jgi:hypothetical protein
MNGNDMSRFFHECFSDPALATVFAIALILVLGLVWLVVRDKLDQRWVQQRLQRKRDQIREKQAQASHTAERTK